MFVNFLPKNMMCFFFLSFSNFMFIFLIKVCHFLPTDPEHFWRGFLLSIFMFFCFFFSLLFENEIFKNSTLFSNWSLLENNKNIDLKYVFCIWLLSWILSFILKALPLTLLGLLGMWYFGLLLSRSCTSYFRLTSFALSSVYRPGLNSNGKSRHPSLVPVLGCKRLCVPPSRVDKGSAYL